MASRRSGDFYPQMIGALLLAMGEFFCRNLHNIVAPGQVAGWIPGSETTSLGFAAGGTACEDEGVLTQPRCNGGKAGDVDTVLRGCGDQG